MNALSKRNNRKNSSPKQTNNSNSIPPSGRKNAAGVSITSAMYALRVVGKAAKSTKNMLKRISPNTSAEDLLSVSGRLVSKPEGQPADDSLSRSSDSLRVRSASPNRMSCFKCNVALENRRTKYFCTECLHVYCENCSSKEKLVPVAEDKHKSKSEQNKLDVCRGCYENTPTDSFLEATVVRFSPHIKRRDSSVSRPGPKPFASMNFEFIDLDDVNVDDIRSPESVHISSSGVDKHCENLSLEDVLAGIEDFISPIKQLSEKKVDDVGTDMHMICSIGDTSTHSDCSEPRAYIRKVNPEDTFELFSPSVVADSSDTTGVLNAFRYDASPPTKALATDMQDSEASPLGNVNLCDEEEYVEPALECNLAVTSEVTVAIAESDPSLGKLCESRYEPTTSDIENADDAVDRAVVIDGRNMDVNTCDGILSRSPGCDTSGEAHSEASPTQKDEDVVVPAISVHNVDQIPALEVTGDDHSPLASTEELLKIKENMFISPPWSVGSNKHSKRTHLKASAESKLGNRFFVSPAMNSLEYSGASSLSGWTGSVLSGLRSSSHTLADISPAAVFSRRDFDSILDDNSSDKSSEYSKIESKQNSLFSSPVFALSASPPWSVSLQRKHADMSASENSALQHTLDRSTANGDVRSRGAGGFRIIAALSAMLVLILAVFQYAPQPAWSVVGTTCATFPVLCFNHLWTIPTGQQCSVTGDNTSCHSPFPLLNTQQAVFGKIKAAQVNEATVTFSLKATMPSQKLVGMQKLSREESMIPVKMSPAFDRINVLTTGPRKILSVLWYNLRDAMQLEIDLE